MEGKKTDVLRLMENIIFLKKYTLFSRLGTEEVRAIALIARELEVEDGACVVREGDAGDSFFIIRRGQLRIVKGGRGNEVELAVLEQNACFGEMAMFEENALRSASVFARGKCTLLCIMRDDFVEAMMNNPGIAVEMSKMFADRLRENNEKLHKLSQAGH